VAFFFVREVEGTVPAIRFPIGSPPPFVVSLSNHSLQFTASS
jgi:hypothetical protein